MPLAAVPGVPSRSHNPLHILGHQVKPPPTRVVARPGLSSSCPRHWRSQQGHSCSWGSYSRLPFPPDQIQHRLCYRLLPSVTTSHCNSTIHNQQPATSSTCPGRDPAAPAQSMGTLTGQDHKWRVSWPWTQSSLLSPLPQAKPASGCTMQPRVLPTVLHGTEEDQENGSERGGGASLQTSGCHGDPQNYLHV